MRPKTHKHTEPSLHHLQLTSLSLADGFWVSDARVESNVGLDFLDSIVQLLEGGMLLAGDILIIDNATVHNSAEIAETLGLLLQLARVRLVYLQTYSPELNLCELVFAEVKSHLYYYRDDSKSFLSEIAKAFNRVSLKHVANYYRKCIATH